jgi:hypothetical protein
LTVQGMPCTRELASYLDIKRVACFSFRALGQLLFKTEKNVKLTLQKASHLTHSKRECYRNFLGVPKSEKGV